MERKQSAASDPNVSEYFDAAAARADLSGKLVRGGAFLTGATVGRALINLVSAAILARLLDPEAYGLLAMVFVVTGFLVLFRDMNLTLATVQRKTITHAQISTLFWFNVGISAVLALVLLALAPAVAWFYDEPRLFGIAALLTLPILIRGVADQHKALMRRQMHFGTLVAIDLGTMLVGYVTAVVLACYGFGYWSLVWLRLSTALADVVACWGVTRWRPGLPVRGSGVRGMIAFGANLTAFSIVRYASRSVDNALIGWQLGPSVLGIYSRSRDLLGQVSGYAQSPFSLMGVPALSRLIDEPDDYRKTFCRLAQKIALIALPSAVVIGCLSNEIVSILLGAKWLKAGPVMAILSILIFTECTFGFVNWLMISQARGAQLLRYSVYDASIRVGAVAIGLHWGMTGIASGLALSTVFILMPTHIWYACREGPVRQSDVYKMLAPVIAASLAGLVVVLLVRQVYPMESAAGTIAVGLPAFAAAMGLTLLIMPSGRRALWDVWRGFEIFFSRWTRRRQAGT